MMIVPLPQIQRVSKVVGVSKVGSQQKVVSISVLVLLVGWAGEVEVLLGGG